MIITTHMLTITCITMITAIMIMTMGMTTITTIRGRITRM